jgi:magnesium transporter
MERDILKLVSEIEVLLQRNDSAALRAYLSDLHPSDLAEVIEQFEPDVGARLLALSNAEDAAEALDEMEAPLQRDVLASMSQPQIAGIIDEMPDDDLADLVGDLGEDQAQRLLSLLDVHDAKELRKLLQYPEDTAGGIMTTEFVWVAENLTAEQAMERIRKLSPDAEMVNYVYVLNGDRKLRGVLSLRELVLASPGQVVRDFMQRNPVSARVDEDQEDVARRAMHYDLLALPVVDPADRMLGIVTIDDLVDVIDEEAAEDLHGVVAGGHGPAPDRGVAASAWGRVRVRLPWLLLLMAGDFLSANVIRSYSHVLETAVALAFFIPVLLDMGGNVGTQSLAMTIRGLATGEIDHRDLWRLLWRETRVGLVLGLVCGGVMAGIALLWQGNLSLGLVIGGAMIATLSLAAVLGTVVPMIFDRLGIDSAVASSPFITSAVDVAGLIIYFAIARSLIAALV